ncbi:hypothetical protein ACCO45_009323 [Purpureocillium lilacinum]|uniref:Uncharacterized protein n=1 Tax=Purpureocillium lilacinum TaxID=33203 RepID=A0ACC4DKX3_PURLI
METAAGKVERLAINDADDADEIEWQGVLPAATKKKDESRADGSGDRMTGERRGEEWGNGMAQSVLRWNLDGRRGQDGRSS